MRAQALVTDMEVMMVIDRLSNVLPIKMVRLAEAKAVNNKVYTASVEHSTALSERTAEAAAAIGRLWTEQAFMTIRNAPREVIEELCEKGSVDITEEARDVARATYEAIRINDVISRVFPQPNDMDQRYIVSRVEDGLFAIWDDVRGEFHAGPIECRHKAERSAFVLNSREHARNHQK